MPYVERDAAGQIIAVFAESNSPASEWVDIGSAELRGFINNLGGDSLPDALGKLHESDQSMIRVVEDLVDTLISQNLIHFTDLPDAAQAKLLQRRSLRQSVNALNLFRDDDQEGLI